MKISTYHRMLGRHINMVPNQLTNDFNQRVDMEMKRTGFTPAMLVLLTIGMMQAGETEWITAPEPTKIYYRTVVSILKDYRDNNLLAPLNVTIQDLLQVLKQ